MKGIDTFFRHILCYIFNSRNGVSPMKGIDT